MPPLFLGSDLLMVNKRILNSKRGGSYEGRSSGKERYQMSDKTRRTQIGHAISDFMHNEKKQNINR